MKMALQGTTLLIKDADNVQFTVIKSWNKMKWDRKAQLLRGTADIELLDKLASIVRLPPAIEDRRSRLHALQDAVDTERVNPEPTPAIEDRRSRLHALQDAVDTERVNPEPTPFFKYPVKLPLYAHQMRGANMALLTFGWVPVKGA